jgi:hypothetical protein
MALLWASGGGLQSVTGDVEFSTVTGTVSIQSAVKRVGPFAIRTNPTAANSFVRYHWAATDVSGVLFLGSYLRIDTAPAGNVTIARIANAANDPAVQLRLTPSRTLVLLDAAGNPVGAESAALALNTFYLVEYGVDASTAPGTVTARLNGIQFASGANSSQVPWSRWLYGPVASTTCDLYWADLRAHDNTGTVNNSWPGEGVVVTVFPTGAGDANQWNNTTNGAGTTSNWNLVDEAPPDDATTFVQTGSATAEDMYTVGSTGMSAGDTVRGVMVGARFRNNTADAAAAFKVQVKKTSGGTVSQSAAIVPNATAWRTNAPNQPRNYPIIRETDPDGSAWTASTVASMQIGVKATAAGTNRVQVTTVWAVVVYTPGTGGSTVHGTAAANLAGFTATATGVRTVHGTASASAGLTASATGQRSVHGVAAATTGLTASATGKRTVAGQATTTTAVTAAAAGTRTVHGTAATASGFEATAAGTRKVTGEASATFTADAAASGVRTVDGTAQADLGAVNAAASGTRTVLGTATTDITADTSTAGVRTVSGTAAVDIAFTADVNVTPVEHGTATANLGGVTATASGVRTVHGTASAAFSTTAEATGRRTVTGTATADLGGVAATVQGQRTVHGAATTDTTLEASAAGQRTVHGDADATIAFTAAATGGADATGDVTITTGPLARGWTAGEPARAWTAGTTGRPWTAGAPTT